MIFFIILFTFNFDTRHSLTYEEIYCGFIFLGIGMFGLYTIKTINLISITPFMILNIFGCIFASVMVILAGVRMSVATKLYQRLLELCLIHDPHWRKRTTFFLRRFHFNSSWLVKSMYIFVGVCVSMFPALALIWNRGGEGWNFGKTEFYNYY